MEDKIMPKIKVIIPIIITASLSGKIEEMKSYYFAE